MSVVVALPLVLPLVVGADMLGCCWRVGDGRFVAVAEADSVERWGMGLRTLVRALRKRDAIAVGDVVVTVEGERLKYWRIRATITMVTANKMVLLGTTLRMFMQTYAVVRVTGTRLLDFARFMRLASLS